MNWLDTMLNLSTFVVIGVLVWLYVKPEQGDERKPREPES